jgi:hypothetical protein
MPLLTNWGPRAAEELIARGEREFFFAARCQRSEPPIPSGHHVFPVRHRPRLQWHKESSCVTENLTLP